MDAGPGRSNLIDAPDANPLNRILPVLPASTHGDAWVPKPTKDAAQGAPHPSRQ